MLPPRSLAHSSMKAENWFQLRVIGVRSTPSEVAIKQLVRKRQRPGRTASPRVLRDP